MTRVLLTVLFVLSLFVMGGGCESSWGSAGLGAAGGAVATGGGYEYNAKKQKDRVEQDYKDSKIDKKEYDIRMDQIDRMSVFQ
jgi:hypothetical protein